MAEQPIIVAGAGAAGLIAAYFAAQGPRPVILLEAADRPGRKILISGGGRCNVLPARARHSDFHTDGSPNTVRKILAGWPLAQVLAFFQDELAVPLTLEPETGKLFPESNRAATVLDALLTAVTARGVTQRFGARLVGLAQTGDGWRVQLGSGDELGAARVILATGGLSIPALGGDATGLNLARDLGHMVIPPYPALTPLTTSAAAHKALAGLALTATVSVGEGPARLTYRDGFLFTHRGYSGPAVLNVSHVPIRSTFTGGPRPSVRVEWTGLSAAAWDARLQAVRGSLASALRGHLPERLMGLLLTELELTAIMADQLRRADRERLVTALTDYALPWSGHEGYRVAEVMGGGVALGEVQAATLESRRAPGLYFCGELLDAFGPIGGYNFLWAWVTGKIAGAAAAGMTKKPPDAGADTQAMGV